jgi:hypothetical protein
MKGMMPIVKKVIHLIVGIIGKLISEGISPFYNIALRIEVAAMLYTVFMTLVNYKEEVLK